ncbi:MAG: hypothetical protein ACOYB0_01480 [Polynucleobacter sp.]
MTSNEIISLAKDLILSGAAITGAVVAIKGLGTWRRQLQGQSEYDLSRRILVSLFKYRDALNTVRNPFMWNSEMPSPSEDEAKLMTREKIQYYGTSKAYEARWNNVQKERANLYADLLEAEALWGKELNDLFKVVFLLQHELFICINRYLEVINPDTDDMSKKSTHSIKNKSRDIMYSDLSDEGDDFQKDLMASIKNIEKYLKPKLSYKI